MKFPLVSRKRYQQALDDASAAYATLQVEAARLRVEVAQRDEDLSRLRDDLAQALVTQLRDERKQAHAAMRQGGTKLAVRGRLRLEGAMYALNRAAITVQQTLGITVPEPKLVEESPIAEVAAQVATEAQAS